MQLNGSARWQILKDLLVKADVFFWDGAQFRNKQSSDIKMNAAADLNLSCEFAVSDKIQIWAQFNNILNQHYQRWNQYEVLGFNVLGGVIIRFSK
jgi:outer membrane cobalamin receptor